MANYVRNTLEIKFLSASAKEAAIPTIFNNGDFDFNTIIPMPEWVSDEESLNWCIEHWGTKWSAIDPYVEEFSDTEMRVDFETANSEPAPIFEAMSRLFPEATITVEFANEDIGYGCARRVYQNGKIVEGPEGYIEDFEEAVYFACDFWGRDPDEYLDENEDE